MDSSAAIRWAILTLGLAAAVGLSAYWTALASRPPEPEPPTPQVQPAPGLVPIPATKRPASNPAARDKAYRRGRRVGFREGRLAARRELQRRLGFLSWSPGAAYLVSARNDGKGIDARVGPLQPGVSYQLCRGGRRVCLKRPD